MDVCHVEQSSRTYAWVGSPSLPVGGLSGNPCDEPMICAIIWSTRRRDV
jgi:hypothetical protein